MASERLDFIQALRGLAALAVVFYHASFFDGGYAGVDLFFVISGMIMVHTTWHVRGSLRDATTFFLKRFARIWPVYAVATVLFVFAAKLTHTLFGTHWGRLAIAKALLFYPHSIAGSPMLGFPPLNVGWTLVYEFWFYVMFAFSLAAGRFRWAVLAALFGVFLVVVPELVTGGFHMNAYMNYELRPAVLNVLASPMMWEFAAGVVIGLVYASPVRIRARWFLDALAIAAAVGVLWQLHSGYRHGFGPLCVGVGMAALVLALALRNKVEPLRVPRPLLWLGDISFSLYLVHQIPRAALLTLLPASLASGRVFAVVWIALGLAFAHLSWRVLERGLAECFRGVLIAAVSSPQARRSRTS